jgi:hypothetical protein
VTRLKWIKAGNEYVAGPVLAGKDAYLVLVSVPKFEIVIYSKKKQFDFKAKSLRAAKILAKSELIKLGARFYDEVRIKI